MTNEELALACKQKPIDFVSVGAWDLGGTGRVLIKIGGMPALTICATVEYVQVNLHDHYERWPWGVGGPDDVASTYPQQADVIKRYLDNWLAEFTVAARADDPGLLAEVNRLRAALVQISTILEGPRASFATRSYADFQDEIAEASGLARAALAPGRTAEEVKST